MLFAIAVENMAEIIQLSDITRGSDKEYIVGSIELRGKKVPVLNFESYFGMPAPRQYPGIRSLILLKRNGTGGDEPVTLGIVVDRIEGVHPESELTFFPFPEAARNKHTEVYQGLLMKAQDFILLLNVIKLMDAAKTAR